MQIYLLIAVLILSVIFIPLAWVQHNQTTKLFKKNWKDESNI